jgi:hypothetical protein
VNDRAGGKANRLPLLGNAIVGAVMLLRGDAAQEPPPVPEAEKAPDLARFSVVLDLPKPEFSGRIAPDLSRRTMTASDAPEAEPASGKLAPQVTVAAPVVAVAAGTEPVVATPPGALRPEPVAKPEPVAVPDCVALAPVAPTLVGNPGPLAAPSLIQEPSARGEASLAEVRAPLGDTVREAKIDPFPVPVFEPPTLAAKAPFPPPVAAAVEVAAAATAIPPASSPRDADSGQRLASEPATEAAPDPDPAPRLALAMPVAAVPKPAAASPATAPAQTRDQTSPAAPQAAYAWPASEAPFPPGAEPTFSYDDELVLQIETVKREMADTIIAYGTRSGVYLPFGGLTRFLDLSIAISDEGRYASGWFLSEDRTITINLREGTMVLSGKEIALQRGQAIAFDGELYLRAEDFAQIFPLRLTTDLRAQLVRIEPLEEFPYAQRLARDAARKRLESRKGKARGDQWPRETTPWLAFSVPMTDVELRAATDSSQGTRLEGDLRLAGDLAFMTARAYLSGSSRDGLTGARFELGRRDPDGALLGPLRATEFQLGDVDTQALPLGLRGIGGRGAAITNAPIDSASLFDAIDLRGELPEGYEVELYRNDVLIGSTRTPVNGQYEFLQVPVDFGQNVFRLVFFGPQGQRYEDVRRVSVGDGRRRPGELVYGFGIAQKDVNVLGVRGPFDIRPPDYGTWRATGSLEYGITSGLTAQVAGSWFETGSGSSWLASAGLRTGIGGTALRADVGLQKGGGKSAQFGVGGQLFGATYSLTHAEYSGRFIDEVRAFSSDFLDRASELNISATLSLGGEARPVNLPLSLRARRLDFADGRIRSEASLRASARVAGLLLSKTVEYASNRSPRGFTSDSLVGGFDLATLSGSRTQYRAAITYAAVPKLELRSAAIRVDHAFGPETLASASLGHTFNDGETSFGIAASRRFKQFNVSLNGEYAVPSGAYSGMIRIGFGFGRNPVTGRFFLDQPGLAAGGALAVRAYHDRNADNRLDQGDLVLPEVEFGVGGKLAKADSKGVAMIGRLGDGTRTSYRVDMESLPDIALYPRSEGISFVPRAGRVHVSDFAVEALSEIEGTARFVSAQGQKPVSGVLLELVGPDGAVVRSARTEGDGFYLFEQVAPGQYTIRIEPGQAQRLGLVMTGDSRIAISPEGEVARRDLAIAAER